MKRTHFDIIILPLKLPVSFKKIEADLFYSKFYKFDEKPEKIIIVQKESKRWKLITDITKTGKFIFINIKKISLVGTKSISNRAI